MPIWPAGWGQRDDVDIIEAKEQMRAAARLRRAEAFEAAGHEAANRVAGLVAGHFEVEPGEVVAGYFPVREELDPRPTLHALAEKGAEPALPVIVERGQPLIFRAWHEDDALAPGNYGIPVPPASAPEVVPRFLLVPLLAFDEAGYRLGYGAGYYDRTLRLLRGEGGPVRAVGLAFAVQKVDAVPHHDGDQRLDWVVTEAGIIDCSGQDAS